MDKRILFIEMKESFLSRAITDNLTKSDYLIERVAADMTKISKLENMPDMLYLNLEEGVKDNNELIVYLKDLCLENDKFIFLAGQAEEIEEIKSRFAVDNVAGCFPRPVNAKTVAETFDAFMEKDMVVNAKKHILVVDDSGSSLRSIQSWLKDKYRVSLVNSAANAISFLSSNRPDLILLDYEMPVCSGPQMLGMIRQEPAWDDIPVMFLTGKSDEASVRAVLSLKPQGYLLKSLPAEQIVATIDKFFTVQKANS